MRVRAQHLGLAAALLLSLPAQAAPDWAAFGKALGKEGAMQAGDIYKVSLHRPEGHARRSAAQGGLRLLARLSEIRVNMPGQETPISKRRLGPAPEGGVAVLFRLERAAKLDGWIAVQPKPVSRPEAIQAMVAAALEIMDPVSR